jgi:hypothetical protein
MQEGLILENFGAFVADNSVIFDDALTSTSVITDDMYYESYTQKLLEGFEESQKPFFQSLFDRQRQMIIEEGTTMLGSPEAISYSVTSFPMLLDIYAEPLLSQAVTVYPSDKPIMSIPRLKWTAKIIGLDGAETKVYFPNANQIVRPGYVTLVSYKAVSNLFTLAGITTNVDQFRINKRNFKITNITFTTNDGTTDTQHDMAVIIIADARGNFDEDITLTDANGGSLGVIRVSGSVNFDNGQVTYGIVNISFLGTVTTGSITFRTRIFGVGNGKGVVKARPEQSMIDINADVEDSFEIENIEEIIQDWKSLYNLDIIAQVKDYVKDQMKLNKDYEIAELLETNIPSAKKFGHYAEVDFSKIKADFGTNPRSFADIFKNILPVITMLQEIVRKNTRLEFSYVICGIKAAALLKSLQEFTMKFSGAVGEMGQNGTTGDFAKLQIISSFAVADDLIHLVTKSETLSQSTILEVSHKPFYVIREVTNSINRTFIKSRNWIGIVRSEGIATIKITGISGFNYDSLGQTSGVTYFGELSTPDNNAVSTLDTGSATMQQ